MDKETETVRDIFYSSCIEVRPDGFMRYRSANYLNEPEKKNELKFEFVGNIVGEQWREYKQVWVTFVNKKLIVPREDGEKEIVGILFKDEYNDYIQLGLALSTEALMSHANMIQIHKSDVYLQIIIDVRPEDWDTTKIIDLREINVSSSISTTNNSVSV
jgi:hypothetical protein